MKSSQANKARTTILPPFKIGDKVAIPHGCATNTLQRCFTMGNGLNLNWHIFLKVHRVENATSSIKLGKVKRAKN